MTEENEIKELCKKHNIKYDLVKDFIDYTNGAFPFLLGEPSSYLIYFVEKIKKLDPNEIFDIEKIEELLQIEEILIRSGSRNLYECSECKQKISFYIKIKNKGITCFKCLILDILKKIKISEQELKNFINTKIKYDAGFDALKVIFIILTTINGLEFSDKIDIEEIKKTIVIGQKIPKNCPKEIDVILFLLEGIMLAKIHGKSWIKVDIIKEKELLEQAIGSANSFLNTVDTELPTLIHTMNQNYFGTKIKKWLINEKLKKGLPGYVMNVQRETDQAILCDFTLLENPEKIYHDWIPKSQLIKNSFTQTLINMILNEMNFTIN